MDEVFHQCIHLILRPIPILDRKGVKREVLDSQLTGGPNNDASRFSAGTMPLDPRQMPLPRPTPITIHDDGDMPRQ
jgi:hypothetical protein